MYVLTRAKPPNNTIQSKIFIKCKATLIAKYLNAIYRKESTYAVTASLPSFRIMREFFRNKATEILVIRAAKPAPKPTPVAEAHTAENRLSQPSDRSLHLPSAVTEMETNLVETRPGLKPFALRMYIH